MNIVSIGESRKEGFLPSDAIFIPLDHISLSSEQLSLMYLTQYN